MRIAARKAGSILPPETMQTLLPRLADGVAMAAVVAALVLFQRYSHRAREDQRHDEQEARAQHDLFERDAEERRVHPRAEAGSRDRERP